MAQNDTVCRFHSVNYGCNERDDDIIFVCKSKYYYVDGPGPGTVGH